MPPLSVGSLRLLLTRAADDPMTDLPIASGSPPPLFDLRGAAITLWHRRILVLAIALAALVAGGLYTFTTKPSFTANAAILVDPRDVRSTNIDSVLPGIGADSAAIASQVSVIESRDLLAEVYADLKLENDPEYASSGGILSFLRPTAPSSAEGAFQQFQHSVGVEREGLTYVIDVTVKSHDPDKAARIANAIVEHYIARTAADRSDATSDVTTVLAGKIAALQDDVSAAERAVEQFKVEHHIFDDSTGGTLKSQIDQLSGQVIAAQDQLNQAQVKYDQAVAAGTSADDLARLSDVWSSPAMETLRADFNARSAALASAQASYGPKHPTVIAAQAELSKVRGLMVREADRMARELKADRDLTEANLAKVQASLAKLRQQSGASNLAMVDLRQLQRKADAAQAVLNDFMQRSQETSQIEGLQVSQVHVISSAAAPPDATWPKPMLLLPVSAVLGLLLGAGTALLLGEPRPKLVRRPLPTGPERPRREVPKPAAAAPAAPKSISPARRLARFDALRKDVADGATTPLTQAVQVLLHQVMARLSQGGKPFVLALSAEGDDDIAAGAATILMAGLERIGAKPLFLGAVDAAVTGHAGSYDFILVTTAHPLAAHADVEIVTLLADDPIRQPDAADGRLTFTLSEVPREPLRIVASNENLPPALAAG